MDEKLSLDLRSGLPAHLRVLADKYPREMWRGHTNFNQLTAFWLDRHLMFRKVLDKLITETQAHLDDRAGPRYGPELSRYTGFFLQELHGHHGIEDAHYFPQFKPLDARVSGAFDLLDHDHHALDAHLHDLAQDTNAVLRALQAGQGTHDAAGALLARHEAFRHFLDRHLTDEEEVIVPLVLEYGADMA
ncbi:hemerythrin domain-containing protein [Lutimaribacter sp. EGI FJ00015]|uniref:Hemerythrin domain-containing protein n=1 Tax=Lutimaribacter degradans TaxID=2945989 RepID=A0ACC5ZRD5_9RHOB|nr:hemerythrin domain-containing protein [Lutimaribacter sp. EGI FJ00013]MCM2560538.1 hemerythrin domain-containing protein [Lutimaribacter sp. EGI FJ00013]MCO0612518.1 hemerythrin domain-containing protein [Lutimaribacter sp. EGI FJ00015]MCO0634362.1 hemerythrin domain-containing protein [Lutimaribacter sp. EGI FJ00014]